MDGHTNAFFVGEKEKKPTFKLLPHGEILRIPYGRDMARFYLLRTTFMNLWLFSFPPKFSFLLIVTASSLKSYSFSTRDLTLGSSTKSFLLGDKGFSIEISVHSFIHFTCFLFRMLVPKPSIPSNFIPSTSIPAAPFPFPPQPQSAPTSHLILFVEKNTKAEKMNSKAISHAVEFTMHAKPKVQKRKGYSTVRLMKAEVRYTPLHFRFRFSCSQLSLLSRPSFHSTDIATKSKSGIDHV